MRGSVPIVAEPRAYDLDLRDGENCIVVRDNNWLEATRRALGMPQSEVVRLRHSVLALREERLVPNVAAERFCLQLLGQGFHVASLPSLRSLSLSQCECN